MLSGCSIGIAALGTTIFILLICIFAFMYHSRMYRSFLQRLSSGVSALGTIARGFVDRIRINNSQMGEGVKAAGYIYDPKQDIFYSHMNPWQRSVGYCRLYDEAAAPLGMIIDCEPICFEYCGKRWLIEFWKGQYDLTTGCEIGVYTTEEPDIIIPGVFEGPFYISASNADRLQMSFSLKEEGETLFWREGKHWWLTGFKLGEFSEPKELTMDISITLKDEKMRDAFIGGLKKVGYEEAEILKNGNRISLNFDKTHTPQPVTRIPEMDWIMQRKNELLCDIYQKLTREYYYMPDKMKAIEEKAPEIYEKTINIGKKRQLFAMYESIENNLKPSFKVKED